MADKTTHYAVNATTLIQSILFTIFFTVIVALYLTHENKDISQDINLLKLEINDKLDKEKFSEHMVEYSVNNEKTLFNEQVIIKGLNMDAETFHKHFIERMKDAKR